MRGVLATNPQERIDYLRKAVRIAPAFAEAWLALGKTYFEQKSYGAAIAALENIPLSAQQASEAHFYLGLSSCGQGDWARAETAFQFVAGLLPLAEVYNDLGVVRAHKGEKQAVADFEKAIENDPSDADFHFNLGVALARAGDKAGATRELRVALEGRPEDAEAKALLDSLSDNSAAPSNGGSAVKFPAERLKRNYQENAFRQMTTQIASWAEQRFARSEPRSHARYHIELGRELLTHGFLSEAEAEFRHAAAVDPTDPAPLVALAELYEARGDMREARAEAEAALRLHETVDAYLIVTNLDVQEGRIEAATRNIDRVLQLEPANRAAMDLRRTLAAKGGERGQP
jgi:tetratricopeptide (TPR) repeat protein